jgi:hypothetical protein
MKCDIIRDAVNAKSCGLCDVTKCSSNSDCQSGQVCLANGTCSRDVPAGCGSLSPALCEVFNVANARMSLAANKYDPLYEWTDKSGTELSKSIYTTHIESTESALQKAYPNEPDVKISWPDFEKCLWNKQGEPEGINNNVYFKRNDLVSLGMTPEYPIGGKLAMGKIWKSSPLSTYVDYIMNPDLFTIIIILLCVLISISYLISRYLQKRKNEDDIQLERIKKIADPKQRCADYVAYMEDKNYDMTYYRVKCGLPPS